LRGGTLLSAVQANPSLDAEIFDKGHLWTETN